MTLMENGKKVLGFAIGNNAFLNKVDANLSLLDDIDASANIDGNAYVIYTGADNPMFLGKKMIIIACWKPATTNLLRMVCTEPFVMQRNQRIKAIDNSTDILILNNGGDYGFTMNIIKYNNDVFNIAHLMFIEIGGVIKALLNHLYQCFKGIPISGMGVA